MSKPRPQIYHHTQKAPWFLLLFAFAVLFFTLAWTERGDPVLLVIFPLSGLMMAVFGFCFQHLTVADEGDCFAIRFGPMPLFKKRTVRGQLPSRGHAGWRPNGGDRRRSGIDSRHGRDRQDGSLS